MNRTRITLIVLAAASIALLAPTGAQASSFGIPLLEILTGPPGSTDTVTVADVPAGLHGDLCAVTLAGSNNESVHPGNRLTVGSAGHVVVFDEFESSPGQASDVYGTLILGPTVTVSLTFGVDGVSSGGHVVSFDCQPLPTTTTSTVPGATTTTTLPPSVPETSVPVTTPDYSG